MPKLPVISGADAIKKLEKLGYAVSRQKGSHVRLHHSADSNKKPLTVPLHAELKPGLLNQILKDADISRERFSEL
jgi:predicted RNA binding protein YcfA (HicA-like mRNA interferase family)